MTLDELFATQNKPALIVTLEPIEGDDSHVKLTPWVQGVGCLCHLAVNIPKNSIETVEPTGDVHRCCGKQLRVVTVSFKKGATLDLTAVVADLVSKVNLSPKPHHHEPAPIASYPEPVYGLTQSYGPFATPMEPPIREFNTGSCYFGFGNTPQPCPAGSHCCGPYRWGDKYYCVCYRDGWGCPNGYPGGGGLCTY
jgi:hypothetical protein